WLAGQRARRDSRYYLALAGILVLFTWLVITTQADGGCLDQSFGSGGKVTTDFDPQTDASGAAVALQADGKLVVAGRGRDNSTFRDAFALARYNADGTLDTGFGSGGKVITHVGSRNESIATAVAIQADGKIVATGIEGLCCGGTGFD